MVVSVVHAEMTAEQRLQRVRRLVQKTEQAYALMCQINAEVEQVWQWDQGPRATGFGYALGLSPFDAEVSTDRLARLRSDLQELAGRLEQQAVQA